jgi:carbon-monoxide dehydrogenase large subunit
MPTGKVWAATGAAPQGQGHRTTLAQVCAEQLGVPLDDVVVVTGDTAAISLGVGTFASRTAVNAGSAVYLAAQRVRDKAFRIAAHALECAEGDLDLDQGALAVKGAPFRRLTWAELARIARGGSPGHNRPAELEPGLEATAYFSPEQSTYCNGTHVAEVEVDAETGGVEVLRYTVVHDSGRLINPLVVDGQIQGGVAHGIGNALFEVMRHDAAGQPLTATLGDYLLPVATDVPAVRIEHRESPSPRNPIGVKGAGEGGTIPAIAAVIAAVEDALRPFGVRIAEAPIVPERVVQLIDAAQQAGGEESA